MPCPNCDLSGWHVEADEKVYHVVHPSGARWCSISKSCQGGAQERAHWTAESLREYEAKGGLKP